MITSSASNYKFKANVQRSRIGPNLNARDNVKRNLPMRTNYDKHRNKLSHNVYTKLSGDEIKINEYEVREFRIRVTNSCKV
jgi:hypothetical protein